MSAQLYDRFDLHGDRAALRGNPSFVWRAGQERRLQMILAQTLPEETGRYERVLIDGCGVGMYVKALMPYSKQIVGMDIEAEHLRNAVDQVGGDGFQLAACEQLPYASDAFDLVLSHEVLEHVADDHAAAAEIVRVLKPGGRAAIFVPNRWHPFETHGHYWHGTYHFGNTPLINYLPNRFRDQLAPHVRVYRTWDLLRLFLGLPVRVIHRSRIFPGYDNIIHRHPTAGRWLQRSTYAAEKSGLTFLGNSHFLVLEKSAAWKRK